MRKYLIASLMVAVMLSIGMAVHAQDACETSLPSRLVVGEEGRVLYENVVNVRTEPGLGGALAGQIASGGMFTVLDGPRCLHGYAWWQLDYHHAIHAFVGWVAEGGGANSEYWLEPRGARAVVLDPNGDQHFYVRAPDGTMEAEGCLQPPDDYTRVWVGGAQLNARTLFMLDHASTLYAALGGEGNLRNRITQGSYTGGTELASFGTHDGGGALDLSVRDTVRGGVLADVINRVYALRVAGFAAWVREEGLFYPNSPVHIHAIAVGDVELSEAARLQIVGPGGYLLSQDGLIPAYGGPRPDIYGGPVICQWMVSVLDLTALTGDA